MRRSCSLLLRGLALECVVVFGLVAGGLLATPLANAAPPAGLAGSGVATVPADAAFFSSALRLKDQFGRFLASNAFARLRGLPAIARGFDSWEEQRDMPGSPVSMALTFLELPENEQAVELLADMVATDTFLYGEPSCIKLVKLVRVLQAAQQAAALLEGKFDEEMLELEEEVLEFDDDGEEMDEDIEAAVNRLRIIPVRRQVEFEIEPLAIDGVQADALLETLAANLDLVEVPDFVWGFKTGKKEAGQFQLRRLEVLAKLLADMNPDLAGAITRRKVAGGEVLAFTITGKQLPWNEITDSIEDALGGSDELDKVVARLEELDIVVALGLVGDWVVLSIGDSLDHLDKLVLPGGKGEALIDTPAFAKLTEHADKQLTGISYMSEPLNAVLATSLDDFDPWIAATTDMAIQSDLPDDAADEIGELLQRAAKEVSKRLPRPGAWLAFSFLAKQGYEGYVWDWSRPGSLDGAKPLGLLQHAGPTPLGVAVSRFKNDPELLPAITSLVRDGWSLVAKYGRPEMDDDAQEKFDAFAERLAPLGGELADIVVKKFVASLADGQVGLVLDAEAASRRPQAALPSAEEPLPLLEPAIVLQLADRKLFVEGLNDFFAWGDKLVAEMRKIDPDSVPEGYRIPEPEKEKIDGGTVWSFPVPDAGLDDQIRPAIGVGDTAAVFALVPGHAARLLPAAQLETAAKLSTFGEPLAAAAALDVVALIDAVEPWVVYLTRYGCVMVATGEVDPDSQLTAADETPEATEALEHARVVFEVARCLKTAVAETVAKDEASVTHWQNLIEDLPKP